MRNWWLFDGAHPQAPLSVVRCRTVSSSKEGGGHPNAATACRLAIFGSPDSCFSTFHDARFRNRRDSSLVVRLLCDEQAVKLRFFFIQQKVAGQCARDARERGRQLHTSGVPSRSTQRWGFQEQRELAVRPEEIFSSDL